MEFIIFQSYLQYVVLYICGVRLMLLGCGSTIKVDFGKIAFSVQFLE